MLICPQQQAQLHVRRGEKAEAAHYYKLNLDAIDTMNLSGTDAVEALHFLSEHSLVRFTHVFHSLKVSLSTRQRSVRQGDAASQAVP